MKVLTNREKILRSFSIIVGAIFLFATWKISELHNPLDHTISLVQYLSIMFACYTTLLYIFFVFSSLSQKKFYTSESETKLKHFLHFHTGRKIFQSQLNFYFFLTLTLSLVAQGIFFHMPAYFNDFFRYLWDGKIFIHGINPFAYFPWAIHDTPELHNLSQVWYWDIMYFKWTHTIYPPFLQYIFAISNLVKEDSAFVLKSIFWIFNSLSIYFGIKLLQHLKLNILFIAFLIINPLFLFETLSTTHTESIIIFCLLSTLYFFLKKRYFFAGIFFSALILTKFFPIILAPFFFIYLYKMKYPLKNFFVFFGTTFFSLLLMYFPFFFHIQTPLLYESLRNFSKEWILSPGIFQILFSFLQFLHVSDPFVLAKKLSALLTLLSIISLYGIFFRSKKIDASYLIFMSSLSFTFLLLFSSIVASWYVLWILAFIPFVRNRIFALALSFTIIFQYLLIYFDNIEHYTYKYIENGQIFSHQILVWIPPILLSIYCYFRKKCITLCKTH